jgi:hypothetical protein
MVSDGRPPAVRSPVPVEHGIILTYSALFEIKQLIGLALSNSFFQIERNGLMSHVERLNEYLHNIVQHGILIDAELGAVNAWVFMKKNGVEETTIFRVLSHPSRRRTSDTSALQHARSDGLPLRKRQIGS